GENRTGIYATFALDCSREAGETKLWGFPWGGSRPDRAGGCEAGSPGWDLGSTRIEHNCINRFMIGLGGSTKLQELREMSSPVFRKPKTGKVQNPTAHIRRG